MIRKYRFSNELLSKDMSQFWRSVTDLRGESKRTSNIIDDFSNDNDVSECFSRSYENVLIKWVFNCSDTNELYNDVTVDISSNRICESECHTHVISSINIHSAIQLLKSGKTDGFDDLTSNYLLNGSPLIYEYLSFLFTCMLHHSFTFHLLYFHNDSYSKRF